MCSRQQRYSGGAWHWFHCIGRSSGATTSEATDAPGNSFPSAFEAYTGEGTRASRVFEMTVFDSMVVTVSGTIIASLTMELVDSLLVAAFGSSSGSRSVFRVLTTIVIAFVVIIIVMHITRNPYVTHRSDPGPLVIVAPTPALPHVPGLIIP